jgi:hypothetical protein
MILSGYLSAIIAEFPLLLSHMEDKHPPLPPLFYSFPHSPIQPTHVYNARVQAILALQDEIEGLRKDINALKQLVADKEFDMLVCIYFLLFPSLHSLAFPIFPLCHITLWITCFSFLYNMLIVWLACR